jgi:MarR family transcriptional regulator, lower aerobic nicotinate degradation pathway regulator
MNGPTAPDSTPQRLTRLPSWLVNQVALHAGRLVNEELDAVGFRRSHYAVLVALDEQGSASQAALGRRVWIDRSDLHTVVGDLEREALVVRVRDEHDRRRKLVSLTPAGADALKRLDVRVEAAQGALLEPLSTDDRGELLRLLARLVEHHLEWRHVHGTTFRHAN